MAIKVQTLVYMTAGVYLLVKAPLYFFQRHLMYSLHCGFNGRSKSKSDFSILTMFCVKRVEQNTIKALISFPWTWLLEQRV